MSGLKHWGVATLAAVLVGIPVDVAFAQPLPPVKDGTSEPKPPAPKPKPEPAMTEVVYLPASEAPDLAKGPRRYRPPQGFGGYAWGTPRTEFTRLPKQALSIRAAWTRGVPRPFQFNCTDAFPCTITMILDMMKTRLEGGGFHVLSEYEIDGQGFRFPESDVLLFPVLYQFCAHWDSQERQQPENFDSIDQLCGVRMLFETEAAEQLRKLPSDHVTRYELVLAELVAQYGKPAGFVRRGRVEVEVPGEEEVPSARGDREFSTWRWCPAMDGAFSTLCEASIVLSMDPELGRGVVLFATPPLWEYAYVREHGHAQGDPLFALMHARKK